MNKLRSIRFRQALTQLIIEGLKDNTRRLTTDRQYDVGEVLAISEAYGFIYRGLHRIGHVIRIHDHAPVHISGRTAYGLDQRGG